MVNARRIIEKNVITVLPPRRAILVYCFEGAVHKFMVCSADYHDNEEARQGVVTPLLETLLGHDIENFRNPDETSTDGTILFVQSGTQVSILLPELKNMGVSPRGADATHEV